MEELSYRQPPGAIRHSAVQDFHCYEDPLGVWWYLVDGQAKVFVQLTGDIYNVISVVDSRQLKRAIHRGPQEFNRHRS